MIYSIAFAKESGGFDIVESFEAESDPAANEYAEQNYPYQEWYVLQGGKNINGGND